MSKLLLETVPRAKSCLAQLRRVRTRMRVHMIVAGLVLALIGKASATVVDKGTDAQKSCELLVQNSFRNQDEARSAGACEGMIETTMLFAPNLPADVRACPRRKAALCKVPRFFCGILITIRIE